ncbi:retrovirus-related pol polyprotein from transposon TNT 1-94 [Tanacetum coccineum]
MVNHLNRTTRGQELKTVSYHKLYDILKQHQNEVNEIRAERLARIANPLALEPAMVAEDDEMSKEKEIDKLIALISLSFKKIYKPTNKNLRTSSNTSTHVVQQSRIQDDTDDEPEDQELEAHYLYMAKIQEITPDAFDNSGPVFDAEPLQKVHNDDDHYNMFANDREHPEQPETVNGTYSYEQGDTNIVIDSLDMSYNREEVDQDDDDLAKDRDLLASLIEKLKCEIDDSKNCDKLLESSNKTLVDKLKNLKKFQAELDRYHDVNYVLKVEIDCAKAKEDLITKQPIVVPISTREPKRTVNQSVATPLKKTVASESTNQKPRSITRKQYEHLIEIILFIVDSGCSKHMTGNFKLLSNFVEKFLGSRGTDLFSITLQDTTSPNPIYLMAKASSSQAWLWHRRPSYLNFDSINLLSKNDIAIGLQKLKFVKDHICSSYELKKGKRKSFKTKTTPSSKRRLQLLHMDLCGPMRVESINDKKYVLVIVDDYSRYTWTHFLRSKDETPEVLNNFLTLVQRGLNT